MKIKIYKRIYDNPEKEPKEFIGDYNIKQVIRDDGYNSVMIGELKDKYYLIEGIEVCGFNGGIRYIVTHIDLERSE